MIIFYLFGISLQSTSFVLTVYSTQFGDKAVMMLLGGVLTKDNKPLPSRENIEQKGIIPHQNKIKNKRKIKRDNERKTEMKKKEFLKTKNTKEETKYKRG